MRNTLKAFTLVELVIVIVILSILSTIGFISYEEYLLDTRDSKRIAQVSGLRDTMRLALTKGKLPLPDDAVEIRNQGIPFLYQGYAGKTVLDSISHVENTKDPLDETYYTYMLGKNGRDFQLMSFLEKENEAVMTFKNTQSFADIDYTERFPKTFGKKLGIILDQTQKTPLQEMKQYSKALWGSGFIDLNTPTTNMFTAYVTDSYEINGKEDQLLWILPQVTCKKILELGASTWNGEYTVNPSGDNPFKAYCDMTTDGGGWMFTTFVSQLGGVSGLFQGSAAGGAYYPDRRQGISYGLNVSSIPHTEMYFIIDAPDVTSQALTDRKVMNIQYDYHFPLFSIPYVTGTSYAMRFWFTDALVNNNFIYKRGLDQYPEIALRKPMYTHFGLWIEASGFNYPNVSARLPENFYNTSLNTSSLETKSNTWFYIR